MIGTIKANSVAAMPLQSLDSLRAESPTRRHILDIDFIVLP
jgi:hypothetical protein